MMCAWNDLLEIIPQRMRQDVDCIGRSSLLEFRMRCGSAPELVMTDGSCWLQETCCREDIAYTIQSASRYSPWSMSSVKNGYLTASGGHRIGLCGLTLYQNGTSRGLRDITSVCIRVARDYPGIARNVPDEGSVLIIGAPGWGKTTLLRDLIRRRSEKKQVAVVDERGELFPEGMETGTRTDILRGCHKKDGIEQVMRTMGPGCIALDEISAEEDCVSLFHAAGCGVELLATIHAVQKDELCSHPVYQKLMTRNIFQWIVILDKERDYSVERILA